MRKRSCTARNADVYIDLLFHSTHDIATYVPATLGTVDRGSRAIRSEPLAVENQRIAPDVLNRRRRG